MIIVVKGMHPKHANAALHPELQADVDKLSIKRQVDEFKSAYSEMRDVDPDSEAYSQIDIKSSLMAVKKVWSNIAEVKFDYF